jgi:hypothetical protein
LDAEGERLVPDEIVILVRVLVAVILADGLLTFLALELP